MELERFHEKKVATNFLCQICHSVSREPVKHTLCETIYCKDCIANAAGFKCPSCPFDENPKERISDLNRLERNVHGDLRINCLFCKADDLTMSTYSDHPKYCTAWPSELSLIPNKIPKSLENILIISDPIHQKCPLRPYRIIELFHEGKYLKRRNNQSGAFANEDDLAKDVIAQAAKHLQKSPHDISLIHTTHQVLQPNQPIKEVLLNTFSTLSVVNRDIGKKFLKSRIQFETDLQPIKAITETRKNGNQDEAGPSNASISTEPRTNTPESMDHEEWP